MPTTKSVPNSVTVPSYHRTVTSDGIVDPGESPYTLKWTDSVTHGDNIPEWRQKLRDGIDVTTSLSGSRVEVRVQPGLFRFQVPKGAPGTIYLRDVGGDQQAGPVIPTGNPSSLDTTRANNEALGRFATKLVNARSAIQGGVVLGELGQTLRMIRNPAMGLRRLVDDFGDIARNIRSSRRLAAMATHKREVAKNLADAWLEWSFGWKPFLRDVQSGSDALTKQFVASGIQTLALKAVGKHQANPVETTLGRQNSFAKWKTTTITVENTMVIYRGAVRVEARNPAVMDPALFGFSPEQFLPTAWELLPYSFLIDYFSNVGEIIYGWSSLLGRLSWANKTTRNSYDTTTYGWADKSYLTNPSASITVNVPHKIVITKSSVSRAKYTGTYVPDLAFTLPSFGSQKWLNIAALIAGRSADRSWFYD